MKSKCRSAAAFVACAIFACNTLARAGALDSGPDAPDLSLQQTPDNPFYLLLDAASATQPATEPATAPASQPGVDPDRRDQTPQPIDSPPFPMTDWTGPDPEVGFHDTMTPGYLEQHLKGTSVGDFLSKYKIHPYGWIDVGGNYSSSKHNNSPVSYDLDANTVQLDQIVLRLERFTDTYQTDHIDWGFRWTLLYGTDYRYTIAKGYIDSQVFKHNELYGGDPTVECFGQIYFPNVVDGLLVKIGRYISPADIEAQLAPQNYLFTHSLMFGVDPYTYTGVNTHWKLNRNYTIELGVDFGNDMAPWVTSASLNGLAMVRWTSDDGDNGIYGGVNAIGEGKYQRGHDDLQQAVVTWGHRFNENFHMQMELYYMWMYHSLVGGDVISGEPEPFAPGGIGAPIKGIADEWGYTWYLEYKLDKDTFVSFRPGFLDDKKGQRTGYKTFYTDFTIGISHYFTPWLQMRPEVRYDRSYQEAAFDNGLRKNQYSAAMDIIISF